MARTPKINKYERVARDLRALAHPTRIQIMELIVGNGKLSPSQLYTRVKPDVALGSVSHHTRELRDANVLKPAGTAPARGAIQHFYELTPKGRKLYDKYIAPLLSENGKG